MKWAYHIRYKVKAAGLLAIIIAVILINNITEERKYKRLENSISSIYKDRLLPATYLYKLSNHLYQKQLAHEHDADYTTAQLNSKDRSHDAAINMLVSDYEATFLTQEEQSYWQEFKTNLHTYNTLCTTGEVSNQTLSSQLNKAITPLNELTALQAGVGNDLQENSKAILGSTITGTQLENSIVLILGMIAIVLFSVSEKRIYKQQQGELN